jgi:hypothetical protein
MIRPSSRALRFFPARRLPKWTANIMSLLDDWDRGEEEEDTSYRDRDEYDEEPDRVHVISTSCVFLSVCDQFLFKFKLTAFVGDPIHAHCLMSLTRRCIIRRPSDQLVAVPRLKARPRRRFFGCSNRIGLRTRNKVPSWRWASGTL